jgi:hypothetical protein
VRFFHSRQHYAKFIPSGSDFLSGKWVKAKVRHLGFVGEEKCIRFVYSGELIFDVFAL